MGESVTSTPDEPSASTGEDRSAGSSSGRAVGPAGRYALGALLGRGGMADVYQAHDQTLGRDVAVKVLRNRKPEPTDHARFIAEAHTLARLNHPNLMSILDAGISDEQPFLVLELVVGSSLSVALTRAGRALSPERVRTIGAQIAAALAHCHAAGIVHRDVKPGNILLGTGERALLTDFGISRLLDGSAQHTQTGFTIGTASYLAPEQVRGDDLTPAVDMYALGLVLLEACTGQREYTGTPVEAAVARLHRSPRIPDDLPSALAEVLASLTMSDPRLRPEAADAAQALTTGSLATWDRPEPPPGLTTGVALREQPDPLDVDTHGQRRTELTASAAVAEAGHQPPALPAAASASQRRRRPVLARTGWAAFAAVVIALVVTMHGMSSGASKPEAGSTSALQENAKARTAPSARARPAPAPARTLATPRAASSASSHKRSARRSAASRRTVVHAPGRARTHAEEAKKSKKAAQVGRGQGHRGGKGK